jgi:cell wall-associated NlpC family hydrolase
VRFARSAAARRCGALVAATAGSIAVAAAALPAAADPLGDARARAAALAASVDRLQTQAEVATERYDALEAQLSTSVLRSSIAARRADAAQAQAAAAEQAATDHVRALYESGGATSMLATVLDGTSPSDAVARFHLMHAVLDYDNRQAALVAQASTAASRNASNAAAATREVVRLQVAAATAATQVRSLLARQRAALAQATGQVRELVAQQQAAAAAASAERFQQALADAAARAGMLGTTAAPPTAAAGLALDAARSRLGDAYVWGATGPDTFDCSGLTQWSYARAGIQLPRVAADQWNAGSHVALADLAPGDLLFWATDVNDPATIHHVAMYVGDGEMIAAPHTGDVVKVEPVYFDGYIGATRPTG